MAESKTQGRRSQAAKEAKGGGKGEKEPAKSPEPAAPSAKTPAKGAKTTAGATKAGAKGARASTKAPAKAAKPAAAKGRAAKAPAKPAMSTAKSAKPATAKPGASAAKSAKPAASAAKSAKPAAPKRAKPAPAPAQRGAKAKPRKVTAETAGEPAAAAAPTGAAATTAPAAPSPPLPEPAAEAPSTPSAPAASTAAPSAAKPAAPRPPAKRKLVQDAARSYFDALAGRDATTMAAHWHREGIYDSVPLGVFRGPDAVRRLYGEMFAAMPDLRTTVERITADDRVAAVQWRASGTFSGGPFRGVEPTGRQVEIRGIDSLEIEDGKIMRTTSVYDGAAVARGMGLLPPEDSGADRAMRAGLNTVTKLRRAVAARTGGSQ